jgi:recombinase
VPDADEHRAMVTARELAEDGRSLRQIADLLTEAGYRSRGGGPITHRQVGRWLRARR